MFNLNLLLKLNYLSFYIFKEKQYEHKFWFIWTFTHSNFFVRPIGFSLLAHLLQVYLMFICGFSKDYWKVVSEDYLKIIRRLSKDY